MDARQGLSVEQEPLGGVHLPDSRDRALEAFRDLLETDVLSHGGRPVGQRVGGEIPCPSRDPRERRGFQA